MPGGPSASPEGVWAGALTGLRNPRLPEGRLGGVNEEVAGRAVALSWNMGVPSPSLVGRCVCGPTPALTGWTRRRGKSGRSVACQERRGFDWVLCACFAKCCAVCFEKRRFHFQFSKASPCQGAGSFSSVSMGTNVISVLYVTMLRSGAHGGLQIRKLHRRQPNLLL